MNIKMDRFVFGPVPSRRLGYSLGVDIIPRKFCNFNCIYCQVGRTTNLQIKRASFFEKERILADIKESLAKTPPIDFITFSGSGEPTLNRDLGFLIREVKKITSIPVAVITNSSLLVDEEVREELMLADVVLPSLDAASEDIFRYINRPHMDIELKGIIEGLQIFTRSFKGKVWLEVMIIKGINDDIEELEKLREIIKSLKVDKIQLNTVVRPPVEQFVEGASEEEMKRISRFLGEKCEVICSFEKANVFELKERSEEKILEILKRRPLTTEEVSNLTGLTLLQARERLKILERKGLIKSFHLGDSVYYRMLDGT